ncbi:hypothetical protein NHQ30_002769 [Ciborinia camelliae]|nr:hypothetical protein NHQ30_002769 [Ciborinia camelliae]
MKFGTLTLGSLTYGSTFFILYIVLAGLLLVTPVDTGLQAKKNRQTYYIFAIVGCYGTTLLFWVVLLATRLYIDRQVIRAIPKPWIPVEKGDVNKKVRKMIEASLARSAAIAWDSRPRIEQHATTGVQTQDTHDAATMVTGNSRSGQEEDENRSHDATIVMPPKEPVWGQISHNGWCSPTSLDLPNLQYVTVILELPHLIEAKAVSLAPPGPQSTSQQPMPDLRAVDILQRPVAMGLRDYISHLSGIGIISDPSIAISFLSAYEYARFSSNAISEVEFRDLMKQFAELLRSMEPLSPAIIMSLAIDDQEGDIDGDASSSSTPVTPKSSSLASSVRSISIRSGSEGTIQTALYHRPGTDYTTPSRSRAGITPVTPQSKRPELYGSRSQSRGLYTSSSSSSSTRSTSQTSVIKLSRVQTGGSLPYELNIPRMR